uniref:IFRD domain-containing protein n=1 Tax=Steinernema glaseri TaxID=37863 RepID=A0A1I7YJI3_9BILA
MVILVFRFKIKPVFLSSTMGKKGGNRNKPKDGYDRPNKPRGEAGRVTNADDSDAFSEAGSEVTHLTLDDDMTSVIGEEENLEEDDAFGDSPRDRLEEFLDNASHKNPAIRTAAVKNIQLLLSKYYMYETLDKWKTSVVELIEKNMKKSEAEAVLMSTLAALLSIQMGMDIGTSLDQVLTMMRQMCADPSQPEIVRANCASALGICVYLSSEQQPQIEDTIQMLKTVWSSIKANTSSSTLFNVAMSSWSLLAERSSNVRSAVNEHTKIVSYLDSPSLDVRVSAGESLGCIYEIAVNNIDSDYTFPSHDHIVEKLGELATDSVKYRAKRDRRIQRFTFRQIRDFLRGGEAPTVTIKFGNEVLEIVALQEKLIYDMCCKFLHGGMNSHLKSNELIRDVFDLGPVCELIQQRDIDRTRNMHRAKQRDKRSANFD